MMRSARGRHFLAAALALGLLSTALGSEAQSPARPVRVGTFGITRSDPALAEAFTQGLAQLGYADGRNVIVDHRHAGGQIIQGARPSDLPGERPEKFDLIIKMKTAKLLGLAVPPAVPARADRIIE